MAFIKRIMNLRQRLADRCWAFALALILEALGSQAALASTVQSVRRPATAWLALGLTALGVVWMQRRRLPVANAGSACTGGEAPACSLPSATPQQPEPAPAGTLFEEWLPTR